MFTGRIYYRDSKQESTIGYVVPGSKVVYEVLRLMDGKPLFWKAHFKRLQNSLNLLQIPHFIDESELKNCIKNLVHTNNLSGSNLRINFVYDQKAGEILHVEVGQVPVVIPSQKEYDLGVKSGILAIERPNPNVKNLLVDLRKKVAQTIQDNKLWDVVLKNHLGELTEGGRTNLFFIRNHCVLTPPVQHVLPGITRLMIIKICSENGIPVEEKTIKEADLPTFDSAFFTGTSPGVIPIQNINEHRFNVSSPTMKLLSDKYKKHVTRDILEYS